ncbi:MAG TPA: glycosyltransferase family A protein, partial [Chthoniobacterales bacterium]|nr:glycosyltransferase family A protein [Chthoniobacterales bacterium]
HNEEQNIGATLGSLFRQTLLTEPKRLDVSSIEILCLANGCSDGTVELATSHGMKLTSPIRYQVVDIPEPGKSRTWNLYVHDLSDRAADFLILMDADIIFESDDVLEQLLQQLLADPHAEVATDTPIKSLPREKKNVSITDRSSLAASEQKSKVGMLCGQLYCARAEALRRIWLPPELPVEDGYLAAMITTSGFTCATDLGRIAWVPTARHFFRTHRSVAAFISHEARIIVGSTINSWLFTVLWEQGREGHAGAFVARQNRADRNWVTRLIQQKVSAGGAWLVPKHFLMWRLDPLKGQPLSRVLRRAPIALAATALNFVACIRANAILKRENAAAHW